MMMRILTVCLQRRVPCRLPALTVTVSSCFLLRWYRQDYMEMVRACADKDRGEILARSTKLGFLTGANAVMPQSPRL